ncbi:hypothetical protein JCM11641_000723 [Rhodosporidiobolus odoratus]
MRIAKQNSVVYHAGRDGQFFGRPRLDSPTVVKIKSFASLFQRVTGIPDERFEQAAPALLRDSGSLPLVKRRDLLTHARGALFEIVCRLVGNAEVSTFGPFYQLIAHLFPFPPPSFLSSHFAHLALVLFTRVDIEKRPPHFEGFDVAFGFHAYKHLVTTISESSLFPTKEGPATSACT